MGHVRRRHRRNGWFACYTTAAGRRREVKVPGRTKAEAREALARLEAQVWAEREGLAPKRPADVEIETLRAAWRAHITTHCRPRTWESYEQALGDVLDWLRRQAIARGYWPPTMASEVELEAVRAFAAGELARGLTARTVQKKVQTLRQMLRWAEAEGLVAANPLARWRALKGPPRRRRRALSAIEMARLLAASPQPFRDIWTMFLGTGLRTGELVGLEWDDIDLAAGELRVRGETSKAKRDRIVPLRAELVEILRGLRRAAPASRRLVFVNSQGGSWRMNLSRRLKPCLRAAGLEEGLDLHCLRHTFGSQLIAAGADVKTVQALLGHSSATVTLDIYAHEFADRKREAVEAMPLPLGLPIRAARQRPRAMGQ